MDTRERCKLFEDNHSIPLTTGPSEPGAVVQPPLGEVDTGEAPTIGTYNGQQQEEAVEDTVAPGTETQDLSNEGEEDVPARRYPLRSRKQKSTQIMYLALKSYLARPLCPFKGE